MSPAGSTASTRRLAVGLSLFSLYVIWGSTYLAMRVAMESFGPFTMAALRFLVAGAVMLIIARVRGEALPTLRQWRNALLIGTLLLACGNGGVAIAEQSVSSGLAALMVAAVPLWMALFAGFWGRWPVAKDWIALVLGFGGIILLNLGSELRGGLGGVAVLMFATAAWAFGSLWSRRLDLPKGIMAAGAEMATAGLVLVLLSVVHGERLPAVVSGRSIAALAYLVVFGSLVAYTAYLYLLAKVPVPVASSYAYVNPLVALALGAGFYGERLPGALIVSVPLILTAVALVLRPAPAAAPSPALPVRPRSELDAPPEGESRRGAGVRSLERRRLARGADEGEHPLVSRL
jgi:drug/metabolite transporter (DMT)-like permease